MKKIVTIFLFLSSSLTLLSQNLSGIWEGRADAYFYRIEISQEEQSISGTSYARSADSTAEARFLLTGVWQDGQLVLQEIKQLEPEDGGWCLKYMTLRLSQGNGYDVLQGDWQADRCQPGTIILRRRSATREVIVEREAPFNWQGRWSGHLSQSDRDYGFFYELNLNADGTGQSYIVSEDNGGSAYHVLTWAFNENDSTFTISESTVTSKTDPRWKWCIKSANFRLARDTNRYFLEGNWHGYIEGYDLQSGACAPGTVYLEKPVMTEQVKQIEQQQAETYQSSVESAREVRVSRVIEVQRSDLRINVWDSGTVDGDVVTLFLNGERILNKYRVNKSKYSIPVKLKQDNNFLILHAEDLGSIPPNTIAVSVDDGKKEQRIVLSSDLKMSGAILVKQFKVE